MTEERTVTLKVTKVRITQEEAEMYKQVLNETEQGGDACGPWFIEVRDGNTYTCRICYTQGPTSFPYKECIELP